MTRYLTIGALVLTVAAVALAGVQSSRLSSARADLATVHDRLASVQTERDQAIRDRTRAVVVMSRERDRAVAAERKAATLIEQIARDAGTDRDGATAPVLRDTVQGLQKTRTTRLDELYVKRRPDLWRIIVFVDGRIAGMSFAGTSGGCGMLANAIVKGLPDRETLVSTDGRLRITCLPVRPRRAA